MKNTAEYLYRQNADSTFTIWYVDLNICNQVGTVNTEAEAIEFTAMYSVLNPDTNRYFA